MAFFRDRKIFDIFISSTYKDLKEYRQIVRDTISRLGHRSICMENFGAVEKEDKEFIRSCIDQSDIFLFILGRNAGTKTGDKPFVSFEYEHAVKSNKRILAFVPEDEELIQFEFPHSVLIFRSELLSSGRIRGMFSMQKPELFRTQLAESIQNLTSEMDQEGERGWIRSEILEEYFPISAIPMGLAKSPQMLRLLSPLCKYSEYQSSIDLNYEDKMESSRFIWKTIGLKLASEPGQLKFFFDGGSTTLYACRSFVEYCSENKYVEHLKINRRLTISTNSILNFVELATNLPGYIRPYKNVLLFPQPPINMQHGKSYGTLVNIVPETIAAYEDRGWTLSPRTSISLDKSVGQFENWMSTSRSMSLAIISAAGLSIDGSEIGPWVRSHLSMILQRGVYRSEIPVVLLLDGSKWNLPRPQQQAYRILFDDCTWEDILTCKPLCIGMATKSIEKSNHFEEYFGSRNFRILKDGDLNLNPASIVRFAAYNEKFSSFMR